MTYSKIAWVGSAALFALVSASSCSKIRSSSGTASSCSNATRGASASLQTTSNTNVIPVYVADNSTTGTVGYTNEPLVSVTVCTPNHTTTSQCATISNILLDTGSFGLRVFKSAIPSNVSLTQQTVTIPSHGTYNLAECTVFGSGADWGSVQTADVILGNQSATVSIQVIDHGFSSMPSACEAFDPDTDPCQAGFNGILGVGMFAQDCGADCATDDYDTNPGNYFACGGDSCGDLYSCSGDARGCVVSVPTSQQVTNPIANFASGYNNGLSLTLPTVSDNGASAVQGTMTIGISTVTTGDVYPADASGMSDGNGSCFQTNYASVTYGQAANTTAFLDSGSNGLFFPGTSAQGLTSCSDGSGFFCPASTRTLTATIKGYSGSPTVSNTFKIGNALTLVNNGNSAYPTMGGAASGTFDWGLPFFFGRTVYVGLENTTATINGSPAIGPYWAF